MGRARSAALDIGSNSVLLLIADVLPSGGVELVREEFYSPRLGEGLAGSGRLDGEAVERTLGDLGKALRVCREERVERIYAAGTAALREAANAGRFIERASSELGLLIRVLSGREEALLTRRGALYSLGGTELTAVLDVGGGSTECTTQRRWISAPVGAVKLCERFGRSPAREPGALHWLRGELAAVIDVAAGRELVAVGGTATTLACVELELDKYDACAVESRRLSSEGIAGLIERFAALGTEQIRQLRGMERARADIIECGAQILHSVLSGAGVDDVRVSPRGLRHGLLLGAL